MARTTRHEAVTRWTGNRGSGTSGYRAYDRSWDLASPGKPVLACSNDPHLGGDRTRYNPEDMLLAALSSCHMLWYLHLCADAGVVVVDYADTAEGFMAMHADGSGEFTRAVLRPAIVLAPGSDEAKAAELHGAAHRYCFIARSVNFPVECEPVFTFAG